LSDESWIYSYDSETKQRLSQWKSPHNHQEQKSAAGLEFNKEHAHCFCGMRGIVHGEFVSPNTTVNSDFYCDVLRHLRENVGQKRWEIWRNNNWLHHDSAPAHMSLKTTEFVTNNMVTAPHPSYSPDLAPCDFALFPKMKLEGQRFEMAS
jgi:histone-lysine N-methyltransferase SETMAR